MKILIIDDDEGVQYMLQEVCRFMKWDSVVASNGEEGIKHFLNFRPDLIVVDYHMPVMDGLMTTKTIRQMDKKIPIIILTVDERQEIANRFIDGGASDFALKPIKAPDIIARIQVHIKMVILQEENKEVKQKEYTPSNEQEEKLFNNFADELHTKGISKQTLQLILQYLYSVKNPVTTQEIAYAINISYPTVNKYLNFLLEKDYVELIMKYGEIGRPKNKYKLKNR